MPFNATNEELPIADCRLTIERKEQASRSGISNTPSTIFNEAVFQSSIGNSLRE